MTQGAGSERSKAAWGVVEGPTQRNPRHHAEVSESDSQDGVRANESGFDVPFSVPSRSSFAALDETTMKRIRRLFLPLSPLPAAALAACGMATTRARTSEAPNSLPPVTSRLATSPSLSFSASQSCDVSGRDSAVSGETSSVSNAAQELPLSIQSTAQPPPHPTSSLSRCSHTSSSSVPSSASYELLTSTDAGAIFGTGGPKSGEDPPRDAPQAPRAVPWRLSAEAPDSAASCLDEEIQEFSNNESARASSPLQAAASPAGDTLSPSTYEAPCRSASSASRDIGILPSYFAASGRASGSGRGTGKSLFDGQC